MAYTAVEFRPTRGSLVAIHSHRGGSFNETTYTATPVVGIAVYRDPGTPGGENYLVPVSAYDLTNGQMHRYENARRLIDSLPWMVVEDRRLYKAAVKWSNVDDADALSVELDLDEREWVPVDGWPMDQWTEWASKRQAASE